MVLGPIYYLPNDYDDIYYQLIFKGERPALKIARFCIRFHYVEEIVWYRRIDYHPAWLFSSCTCPIVESSYR